MPTVQVNQVHSLCIKTDNSIYINLMLQEFQRYYKNVFEDFPGFKNMEMEFKGSPCLHARLQTM